MSLHETTKSLEDRTLLALVEASRAIIRESQLDRVLSHVAEQGAIVLDAEAASVLLLDPDRDELVFAAATGPKGIELVGERFDAKLGVVGEALRTGRPLRVDDVSGHNNFFSGIDAKTQMHTRSLIAAPLIHLDEPVGVLEVMNPKRQRNFTDSDLDLVHVLANLAAAAVLRGKDYDRVSRDNRALRESIGYPQIIGQSAAIQQVLELCRKVAASNVTVMVSGETGTGKELIARAIHDFSPRHDKPFVAVNCAALTESLLESELFGHEKGAFTGATERKLGRFELAEGGTLLLDELGEMTHVTQVKLLRVLQEREFVRVGGTQTIVCDVRIVAATNRDLKKDIDEGRFREDLYYRLNVFPIEVPPLRNRLEDLPVLVDYFTKQLAPDLGITELRISDGAVAALNAYDWPGNVRELRNVIERGILLSDHGNMTQANLPPEIAHHGSDATIESAPSSAISQQPGDGSKLAAQERAIILNALTQSGWNQSAAARALGITRDHLRYRIKKYDLKRP